MEELRKMLERIRIRHDDAISIVNRSGVSTAHSDYASGQADAFSKVYDDLESIIKSIETRPELVKVITEETIEGWRHWAKEEDGGGGMYGPSRLETLDSIFDAAKVGMGISKSSQVTLNETMAILLRDVADSLDAKAAAYSQSNS